MRLELKRVQEKTDFIERNLTRLEQLRRFDEREFFADFRNVDSAIHELQVSIKVMYDLLMHIAIRLQWGTPKDDVEALDLAIQHGMIAQEHRTRFFQMHKFRNLVVHGYLKVDDKRIYKILQENLSDFRLFLTAVNRVVESEREQENKRNGKKANGTKTNKN